MTYTQFLAIFDGKWNCLQPLPPNWIAFEEQSSILVPQSFPIVSLKNTSKRDSLAVGGQEVIWPGVGQTIFLWGPSGTHAAGTSGTSEVRIPTKQHWCHQQQLTNDLGLFGGSKNQQFATFRGNGRIKTPFIYHFYLRRRWKELKHTAAIPPAYSLMFNSF